MNDRVVIRAGSNKMAVSLPEEWVRRALLEQGESLRLLSEAIREMERFDFKYVVYPELLKERSREQTRQQPPKPVQQPPQVLHTHIFATIRKKLRAKGVVPYCLTCGEKQSTLTSPN